MRSLVRTCLPVVVVVVGTAGWAAARPEPPVAYTDGVGAALLLTNYGFGAAVSVREGIGSSTSAVLEVTLSAGRDEREQEFFVGPFGETVTPYKRHYFLMAPVLVGVEQRLFREAIEDDFRPHVVALAGPVVGYQWPYFEDRNGNGLRDPGEPRRGPFALGGGTFRLGVGGSLALGAYVGESRRSAFAVRIGYAAQYFPVPVELLEPRPEIDQPERRFFGTPVVGFHLVRLR